MADTMRVHVLLSVLLPGFALTSGCAQEGGFARAVKMESLQDGIGGPKALAQPGDFLLENDRIRITILDARPSMGPHTSGASVADADLQRADPRYSQGRGLDQLGEMFPTVNLNVAQIDTVTDEDGGAGVVRILNDGSDGGDAVICTEGPEQSFITLLDALWNITWLEARPYFRLRTDYSLGPGQGAVKMRSTAIFRGADGEWPAGADCSGTIDSITADYSEDEMPIVSLVLAKGVDGGGLAFGDFYLQGGSVDVFTPDWGFAEDVFVSDLLAADVNTLDQPIIADYLAGTADRVSYGLMPDGGKIFVPLFTSSQTVAVGASVAPNVDFDDDSVTDSQRIAPGSAFHYDRWFAIGRGDVGSVVDALLEARGDVTGTVNGYVVEEGTGLPLSGVHVFAFKDGEEAPWLEWTTDVGDDIQPDGSFGGRLPPGDYELLVHKEGRPDGKRVPITVKKNANIDLVLASPRSGALHFTIVDEAGERVPSKLTVFKLGDENPRDPVLGDSYIGGEPAQVVFTADGTGEIILPPGRYQAVASRGLEYELGISDTFTLDKTQAANIELQVVRAIDTTGWISADFHVHGQRSFDSGVGLQARVTTMAAEGVEFFSSNDHDFMTDYRPTIEDMRMERFISSSVGLEVTTIELGHFLGFPLVMDHIAESGGALQWDGLGPQEIIDGLVNLGDPNEDREPMVFVGHPRDGILGYFDQYGVDHFEAGDDGLIKLSMPLLNRLSQNELLESDRFSDDFDAIELLNGKRMEMIRTPTVEEMATFDAERDQEFVNEMMTRTLDEQADLMDGTAELTDAHEGMLDDWFHLLNLGYRYTALGNSDTHSTTSIESGCPRNFVQSDVDDPAFIDEYEVAEAVKAGQVVASYGPFVRVWANDPANGPGSQISAAAPTISIEVQSASWVDVSRVELYENGTLIDEWTVDDLNTADNLNLVVDVPVNPTQDAWYVVVAMGEKELSPVFTPVEIPPIFLEDVVLRALAGVVGDILTPAAPIPRAFPIYPYAVTNPIWVDADGDGQFTAPGDPEWWHAPTER
jgi:hypothetical protein